MSKKRKPFLLRFEAFVLYLPFLAIMKVYDVKSFYTIIVFCSAF
jgi:hypothetical protein